MPRNSLISSIPRRKTRDLIDYCPRHTVIEDKADTRDVTLAEVNTNDGQRMLAFNDFFIGARSHVSARYTLEADGPASRSHRAAC